MEKKIRNTNLLDMLTSEEFVDFCNKKLIPELASLENRRIMHAGILRALDFCIKFGFGILFFFIAVFVFSLVVMVFGKNLNIGNSLNNVMVISIFVVMFLFPLIMSSKDMLRNFVKDSFIRDFKVAVYSMLMSVLGKFKYYDKKADTIVYEDFQKHLKKLKIFRKFDIYDCDDIIKGVYNGLNLVIADICLKYKVEWKKEEYKLVFDGVLICSEYNKNFHSTTVVRLDEGALNQLNEVTGLKRVRLEDPVFEKEFEVYSNDQVEARYLLTTAFMDRLLKVQKKLKLPVTCSFENGKIYIALHSNKNWFDISIQDSCLTDIKTYQKILIDLITVLSVLDTIRADSNIGL